MAPVSGKTRAEVIMDIVVLDGLCSEPSRPSSTARSRVRSFVPYQRRFGGNSRELLLFGRAPLLDAVCWIVAVLLSICGARLE